jgi:pimeloyl-ACP methyl ester carboxylesterase
MPYVTIEDARYFYEISSGTAPSEQAVIILLHGSGGDSSVWEEQVRGLGQNIRTIAPDLPGHGKSVGPCCTSISDYTAWLDMFVKHLRIKRFFLLGHSLGSAIAQEYSRSAPQQVQGLILAGSGMRFTIADEYLETVTHDFPAAVHRSCQAAYAADHISIFYERGHALLSRNGKDTLYNDLVACSAFDSGAWISSVGLPVLVICGSEDMITPPQSSRALASIIPGARLKMITGAGHMLMMEAAAEFNEAVKEFITGANC